MNTAQKVKQAIEEDLVNGIKNEIFYYAEKFYGPFSTPKQRYNAIGYVKKTIKRYSLRPQVLEGEERHIQPAPESKLSGLDDTQDEGISIDEYFRYAEEGNHISSVLDNRKYEASFKFEEPQIICFTSDWHLGAQGTDLKSMMADFKFILDNKILLCINGDAIEGKTIFPKSIQAVITQTLNVHMQIDCIKKILKAMKPQMLAYVLGNHGQGAKGVNAINYMKEACMATGIDFFQGGCLLLVTIRNKEWKIFMRHSPLSKSKVSPLMGIRKLSTLESADIYVGSHLHVPTAAVDYVLSEKRICILTGTYLTEAPYALDGYGVHGSRADFPCVLLTEDDILLFWNMRDAQLYKEALLKRIVK